MRLFIILNVKFIEVLLYSLQSFKLSAIFCVMLNCINISINVVYGHE